jgi:small neutral amino acid transporter SnatA (MarC family)
MKYLYWVIAFYLLGGRNIKYIGIQCETRAIGGGIIFKL